MLQTNRRFQILEIVTHDKPTELLVPSPRGVVPALHLTGGGVLEESLDIMQRVFDACNPEGWWSRAQSDDSLTLLRTDDGELRRQFDRYKYPDRYPQEATPRETVRARATETLLMPLESRLLGQRCLGDPTPCATDLAISPFMRQFAAVEPDWLVRQPLPAIQVWLARWFTNRLFEVCMTKQLVQAVAVSPEYQHLDGSTDRPTD